jgi:hypothetical protein
MARETRAATGNSKPRVFPKVEETTTTKTTTKKAKPKANTTAKRAPKTTTAKAGAKPTGVTKKKAAPKKKTTLATKVKGEAEKVVGAVTADPQKKVCACASLLSLLELFSIALLPRSSTLVILCFPFSFLPDSVPYHIIVCPVTPTRFGTRTALNIL